MAYLFWCQGMDLPIHPVVESIRPEAGISPGVLQGCRMTLSVGTSMSEVCVSATIFEAVVYDLIEFVTRLVLVLKLVIQVSQIVGLYLIHNRCLVRIGRCEVVRS
jgi:hypothetical protein